MVTYAVFFERSITARFLFLERTRYMLDLLHARSVWQVEPHYSVLRTAFAGQDALAQDDLAAEVVDKHLDFDVART